MRLTRAALVLFSACTLTFGRDSFAPDAVSTVGAVDFLDACTTHGDGGSWRWDAKTDTEVPGPNTPIRTMTVDQIIAWSPLSGNWHTPEMADAPRRQGRESRFYRVRGFAQRIGLDEDGDVHIEMAVSDDAQLSRIIVELPDVEAEDSPFCAPRQ